MLEYTTGESKRLVQRLRNAYVENPTAGVGESWKSWANVLARPQLLPMCI